MICAGELRWTVTIKAPPTARRASGAPDDTAYTTVATRRAKIETLGGSKAADDRDIPVVTESYRVTMRRYPDFSSAYLLVAAGAPFDGYEFTVTSVTQTLTETVLTCVRTGPTHD